PNPQRLRVLWVGVAEPSGRLARLQSAVVEELQPLGFAPDKAFHPHLTLARVARDAPAADLRAVAVWLEGAPQPTLGQMAAAQVSLIRSDLRPSGAVYTPLAHLPLGG
ncbi:MAG: RNA 2',3'-cyclic phosphodiesterase, partial [Chloroflexi bacterium]|nr:RNA 2',3'-cyclic phosphodiesterase [Chloroflexota bacterium]